MADSVNKPFILFLPQWYPTKSEPFHGIFVQRHAEAIAIYAKVIVLYATADENLTKGFYSIEERNNENLIEIYFYYKKHITRIDFIDKLLKAYLFFYCNWIGFKRITKTYGNPLLSHTHVMGRSMFFALLLKQFFQIKFVYTEHWGGYYPEDGNYKGWLKLLTPLCLKQAEVIMPVTTHLAQTMQEFNIKGKYVVVPNVVNTTLFTPKTSFIPNNPKIALHISNFDPKAKNVEGMLDVVYLAYQKRKDFVLNIIGYGSEEERLIRKAEELGILDKVVFFLGAKKGVELVNHIQQCDFLFMFSSYENQPCVIIEAMACGKPILATTVGGIPEMVHADIGLLSKKKDVQAMVIKFEEMLNKCSTYHPLAIQKRAVSEYSYEAVGKKFLEVYRTITDSI